MKNKLYDSNWNIAEELKLKYPQLKMVVVAAFGISHNFYTDDTYNTLLGQSIYSDVPNKDCFIGVYLKLKMAK